MASEKLKDSTELNEALQINDIEIKQKSLTETVFSNHKLLPLKTNNKKREYIYTFLLVVCSLYIIYVFFIDDEEIIKKTKYYNRSDFILNLDISHQMAFKQFITDTIEENEKNKCKKNKIKDKIKDSLPILFLSCLLRFQSYEESLDAILTSFLAMTTFIILDSSYSW